MNNKNEFYLQLLSGKTSELKAILLEIHDMEMLKYLFYKDAPNFEIGYLQHVVDFAEGRNDEVIILSLKTQEIIKIVYSYYLTIL